ncbi:ABC transport system ATP-binding protein [Thermoplasma volcanium GSS1]|uniref:ABC transport system ATP-binding protein n=1 Tax=Thermoplasma volcanium (strain ATCC 51530 / DSM 4299 / JCM 9571 / NBRC 15438 / GSS1) TaxID=273116 RepID=Q978F9_THEVO|nr:ABC transporter ATP-binding protein [Thermoplasma volcanium]BAB60598.1 ABC transport system ATP-binding protein [Thermoplasma volcanium GSS1]
MIEVTGLEYIRRNFSLNGLNFTITEGSINGIGGLNGSGKTTLVKNLYGFLKPEGGTILIDGKSVESMPIKEIASKVSVVQQEQPIPMNFTVNDVVSLSGYSRKDASISVDECLSLCGILQLKNREFSTLSGGEKRIVMFAAALYQNTKYVLLDEPMTFLDIDKTVTVMSLIRQMKRMGKTIIVVSHDINFLYNFCDYVILMKSGGIAAQGKPQEIFTPDVLKQVFNVEFNRYESAEGTRFYPVIESS